MFIPRELDQIEDMIRNRVQENLHLDYKASAALNRKKMGEICKDVSAFANSDGGVLIYGVEEAGHLPVRIDEGVEMAETGREWVEQILHANIAPRLDGLEIIQLPLSASRALFVVAVPRSVRGPHQERQSKRYYKRYNFQSAPMEDYEIADIRARSLSARPLVNVDSAIRHRTMMFLVVENIGDMAAEDVTFSFEPGLTWKRKSGLPPLLRKGIRFLAVGKRHHVFFGAAHEVLEKDDVVCACEVAVSYRHPVLGRVVSDKFQIDFSDYLGTWVMRTDVEDQGENLERAVKQLTDTVKRLAQHLEGLERIAGPTGLDLSVTTIRNLQRILSDAKGVAKVVPSLDSWRFYQEVLEIDRKTARLVLHHYLNTESFDGIEDVDGVDEEVVRRIRERLLV